MKRFLLASSIILYIFFPSRRANAQSNQTVVSGNQTTTVNFPAGGCTYNWVNNTPGIGLPASGTGDIAAFKAINTGTTPITANIVATPMSAAEYAYITNAGANTVSVFDISTRSLVATIPVGQQPEWASVSPNGNRVYIANHQSDNVSVIDASSNSVITTIHVGPNPICIAINNDGSLAYVSNSNFGSSYGSISVIDTKTNTVINTISLNYNSNGIVVSKDGTTLYVCEGNWVSVIDVATGKNLKDIAIGMSAISITINPDGSHIYATSIDYSGNGLATAINTTTNTIEATIPVDNDPFGIAISPDGQKVYVSNWAYGNISVITTANNTVSTTIPDAGNQPIGVCFTPDGAQAYVINYSSSDVLVINTANNAVIANIPLGSTSYPNCSGNFISSGTACNSSPITFTITVKPSSVTPVITPGTPTGTISACQGSPSASPNVQQFTVSGTSLTNNITATAPAGFEVCLSANGIYGNTVTIPQSGGTANTTIVYVRSAAAAIGSISGSVKLTSQGANTRNVAVSGKVSPLPTVNNPGNQTVNAGSNTTAIIFTGTASTYNWVNNNPAIGIPASGTGNISAFTAANNGSSPITATLTVTPMPSENAFICSEASNTVTVLNTANNTIVSTITVGSGPIGVAISPDGSKAYVTNAGSATVSVINTITNTVTSTIPVGQYPYGICVSPDGSRIYVTCYSSNYVAIIDASTNSVITTIDLPYTNGIAISPDGSKLYVTNEASGLLTVINTATYAIITKIVLGTYPFAVVTSPDGSRVYVTDYVQNMAVIIDAATNSVIAKVPVGNGPTGITINPDGSKVYVANAGSNTTSVINTVTDAVIASVPVGSKSIGLSVTGDGSLVYVTNPNSQTVSVINALTNTVTATIPLILNPGSFGNFISSGIGCNGAPITLSITVNPAPVPSGITAGVVSGTISACQGSPSKSPHLAQFTVSGNSLTNDIIATAPSGFEVSLSASNGYGNSVTIPQSGGKVNNVTVYVRSAASAAGNISGDIALTSQSAPNQNVAVSGIINSLPTVNPVTNQTIKSGSATNVVNFTGTANTYNWVNDNPAVGATSGTGDISSFIPINTKNTPITSTFTVTPINAAGCSGIPVTFTIEVDPILPPQITTTGTLSPLVTVYGTASTSSSFSISGANINAGISVTPPTGFEVSIDNKNFSPAITVGTSGIINVATVYVRLTSKTPVGNYSGDIILSSQGTSNVTLAIPNSTVKPTALTITASNVKKVYGQTLTSGTVSIGFTSNGLQNNETIGNVFLTYGDGADATAKAGTYTGSVVPSGASGGSFDPKNYTITYKAGDIIATESSIGRPISIPNAFTPNGDGINDVWNIKFADRLSFLRGVNIYTLWQRDLSIQRLCQTMGWRLQWQSITNRYLLLYH